MKQVFRSLPVKITAVILCVLFSFGVLFCGLGLIAAQDLGMFDEKYDSSPFPYLFYARLHREAEHILYMMHEEDYAAVLAYAQDTNLRFAALARESETLVSGDDRLKEYFSIFWDENRDDPDFPYCETPFSPELADLFQPFQLFDYGDVIVWTSLPRALVQRPGTFPSPAGTAEEMNAVDPGETSPYWDVGKEAYEPKAYLVQDIYYQLAQFYLFLGEFRVPAMVLFVVFGALLLMTVIFLCCVAGWRVGADKPRLNLVDRIPLDFYAAILLAAEVFLFFTGPQLFLEAKAWLNLFDLYVSLLCFLAFVLIGLALLLSVCTRVKVGKWWRSMLIWVVPATVLRLVSAAWRFVLFMTAAGALFIVLYHPRNAVSMLYFVLFWGGVTLLGCFMVRQYGLLEKAVFSMSEGNLDKPVDTQKLFGSFRRLGLRLNTMGQGMSLALEQKMRSERLKTELITNVSHDIKTPLTSIINYVDLVQRTDDPQQQKEYLEVLDRQAKRLKKLTVDLIDASKAATGNMPVQLQPTDLREMLDQAAAEYADRLQAAKLSCVVNLPEASAYVLADGWLLWRILDNLLNNVCKYGQQGTRLYIDVLIKGNKTLIQLKNTSHQALNLSPEELLERFVRGDASRSSEGSGLGLDIAKSLTELQHGTFEIAIDGDLFKVTLSFPTCAAPEGGTDPNDKTDNASEA